MKKILSLLLVLCLCIGLCACNANEEKIKEHLEKGEYEEAYDLASDEAIKDEIVAENFLAVYCQDSNVQTEASLRLTGGWFGKVKASENDAFESASSVIAIDNYAKLAEYISMLSGVDILKDYYYGVVEIVLNEAQTVYGLTRLVIETGECEAITVFATLDQTSDDDNATAMYRYIARRVKEKGTEISDDAVARINDRYMGEFPEDVEFEFDLD